MLRALFFFLALVGLMAAWPQPVAAAPGFGLRPRLDWPGDPCLVTNPPGQVNLVFNPNHYAANDAYRDKADALALRTALANAKIQPGDAFSPVVDTIVSDALNTVAEDQRKNVAAQLFSILHSAGLRDAVPARGRQLEPARPDNDEFSLPLLIQRWLVFGLVVLFLARRVGRYFQEVEDEDDFADHLSSLAVAHRWVFPVYMALLVAVAAAEFFQIGNLLFSLSVLFLASSLRRYYCEGHFDGFPAALKVHLALRCALIWLGWMQVPGNYLLSMSAWFHWPVFAWLLLALATMYFSKFYNNEDYVEHREALYWFATGFLFFGVLGAEGGYYISKNKDWDDPMRWSCIGVGVFLAWIPLLGFFRSWSKNVSDEIAGRTIFDIVFSFGDYAAKPRKEKRLPSVQLFRHWRDHGEVEKAWASAKGHLFKEARALQVWLFAMETAVLYRRQPNDALEILKRLCVTEEFHYDHRRVAVSQMQGWMAAAGFSFDPARFKIERPALEPSAMTNKVEFLCQAGRFADAEKLLKEVLANDSLNEAALTQLVRLYCQDLKKRAPAEKLIAEAGETFGPNLLNFLKNSMDDWMKLPTRSRRKPSGFFVWLRRFAQAEADSPKMILTGSPAHQPASRPSAAAPDPIEKHLARLKQGQPPIPDAKGVHDPVEKLLVERRFGSAVELLQQQADSQPENFEVWLRYAEAYGNHCGDLNTAEKIIRQMERSGNFKKVQIRKAYTRLKKWRDKHPHYHGGW